MVLSLKQSLKACLALGVIRCKTGLMQFTMLIGLTGKRLPIVRVVGIAWKLVEKGMMQSFKASIIYGEKDGII